MDLTHSNKCSKSHSVAQLAPDFVYTSASPFKKMILSCSWYLSLLTRVQTGRESWLEVSCGHEAVVVKKCRAAQKVKCWELHEIHNQQTNGVNIKHLEVKENSFRTFEGQDGLSHSQESSSLHRCRPCKPVAHLGEEARNSKLNRWGMKSNCTLLYYISYLCIKCAASKSLVTKWEQMFCTMYIYALCHSVQSPVSLVRQGRCIDWKCVKKHAICRMIWIISSTDPCKSQLVIMLVR